MECRVWKEQINETGIDHISNSITIIQAHNIHTLNNETQITNRFDWEEKKKKKIWHLFYVEYYSLGLVLLVKLLISNAIERMKRKKKYRIENDCIWNRRETEPRVGEHPISTFNIELDLFDCCCCTSNVHSHWLCHSALLNYTTTAHKKCVSSPNFHRNSMLQSCCFRFPISFDTEI